MRSLCLAYLLVLIVVTKCDDLEKYRPLREQCEKTPSKTECVQLRSRFLSVIQKCQKITTQQQLVMCRQVKETLCAVFPSVCAKPTSPVTTAKPKVTTKQTTKLSSPAKTTASSPKSIKTTKATVTPKIVVSTKASTTVSTTQSVLPQANNLSDDEFSEVPVNPEDLRTRGEYCVRHGREKKCQVLLNNLKNTYSSCSRKTTTAPPTKPEHLDCHSFQTHLCKAFPKFPPCTKNAASN